MAKPEGESDIVNRSETLGIAVSQHRIQFAFPQAI
jgi:hypothetical protein